MMKVHSSEKLLKLWVHNNINELYDECVCTGNAAVFSPLMVSLWLYEVTGLPVYQRSSVRWSVWWKSLQNHVSSQLAALRSSTCGGSTCYTLCGPAWANSWVFTYNVDFTYDLAKIFLQAVFVLYISMWHFENSVCWCEGLALTVHLERKSLPLSTVDDKKLTFFWRRQWKMKINIPWKVLKMVKRYAMTIEASLMKKRPKDHVRPSRHSRAKAPMTQDLKDSEDKHKQRTNLAWETFTGLRKNWVGFVNRQHYEKIGGSCKQMRKKQ